MHITHPTLLIDKQRVLTNLRAIKGKAEGLGLDFVPHAKTHQNHTVAGWLRDEGVEALTVSSVRMAQHFAADGWRKLTVAFPANLLEIEAINALAAAVELTVLVAAEDTARFLNQRLAHPVRALVEIDTGQRRTGIMAADTERVAEVVGAIRENGALQFVGFYTHPGHTYHVQGKAAVEALLQAATAEMRALKAHFAGLNPMVVLGDTPSASLGTNYDGVDVLGPGNFVYYDLTQCQIGACEPHQIAAAVACPIVGKYPGRGQVVVYGGAVHFSKDHRVAEDGTTVFGQVVRWTAQGLGEVVPGARLVALSQEHGTVEAPPSLIDGWNIGTVLAILPHHACLAAHQLQGYEQVLA